MNTLVITVTVLGILLFIYLILGFGIALYVVMPPKRKLTLLRYHELDLKKVPLTLFDVPFREIMVKNKRNEYLSGRYYKADSDKFIIILHGVNASSYSAVRYTDIFLKNNINVILPDFRKCGVSEGRVITFGHLEHQDTLCWIDKVYEINKNAKIGLMGESMGGATALMTAAKTDKLAFCIDYCGFSSMNEILKDNIKKIAPYLIFTLPAVKLFIRIIGGFKVSDVKPYEDCKNIKCPVLVLHSKGDAIVPYRHAEIIMKNLNNYSHTFFQKSGHGLSHTIYKTEYENAINNFLKKIKF